MRITIVSPYPVYPPKFGGQARIWGLAKGYASLGHTVRILCNYTYQFRGYREGFFENINVKFVRTYFQGLAAYFYSKKFLPLIVSYPFNTFLGRIYKKLLNDSDLVIFEQPFLAGWMKYINKDIPRIYSAQNVESNFELINFPKNRISSLLKPLLSECEKKAIDEATALFSCSEEDVKTFRKKFGVKKDIILVENGFEDVIEQHDTQTRSKLRMKYGYASSKKIALFIGSHSPPNIEAAKFISDYLAQKLPDWLFVIVGEAGVFLTSRFLPNNVVIIGEVDDLAEWLIMADVGLLPLNYGFGSSLKLLEYLRSGLPVISTAVGLRGYRRLEQYIPPHPLKDFVKILAEGRFFSVPKEEILRYTWKALAHKSLLELSRRKIIK